MCRVCYFSTALLTVALGYQTPVAADVVMGVTATSDNGDAFGTSLANTLNGLGLLNGIPSLADDHVETIPANSWIGGAVTGTVTFDFGGLYWTNSFAFWNQNNGGPGLNGTSGINQVLIEYSDDGLNFLPLIGGPTSFSQVTTVGAAGPESFHFDGVFATHFRFNILSNHGDANTGFAEVAFYTPEPRACGWALFAACVVWTRGRGQRR